MTPKLCFRGWNALKQLRRSQAAAVSEAFGGCRLRELMLSAPVSASETANWCYLFWLNYRFGNDIKVSPGQQDGSSGRGTCPLSLGTWAWSWTPLKGRENSCHHVVLWSLHVHMNTCMQTCTHARFCRFLKEGPSSLSFLAFNRCLHPMVSGQLYTAGFSLGPVHLRKWVLLTVIACGVWVLLTCALWSRKNRVEKLHTCSVEHVNVSCSLQTFKEIMETGIGCLPLLSRLSPSEAPYNVTFPRDTGETRVCRLLMTLWSFFVLFCFTWFACLQKNEWKQKLEKKIKGKMQRSKGQSKPDKSTHFKCVCFQGCGERHVIVLWVSRAGTMRGTSLTSPGSTTPTTPVSCPWCWQVLPSFTR